MIHPFLLLENINRDKTGISHPFTIVIISPAPFIALSSPFHNPFPIYRKEYWKDGIIVTWDYYSIITMLLRGKNSNSKQEYKENLKKT